jgi:hypothetical protein
MAKPLFPLVAPDRETGRRLAGPARYAKRVRWPRLGATRSERPATEIETIRNGVARLSTEVACGIGRRATAIRLVHEHLSE